MTAKRVLVSPLDWGLGHASRCIPVIRMLRSMGAEVIIGADRRPAALLQKEFPDLEHVRMPGYDIVYPVNGNMAWSMFRQLPKIFSGIVREQRLTDKLLKQYRCDGVISDNRWGVHSAEVPSVIIVHQLRILLSARLRWGQWIIDTVHRKLLAPFTEVWVPDVDPGRNILGKLADSSVRPKHSVDIGPLSRLQPVPPENPRYDVLAILSGPEPQRTIFESMIIEQLKGCRLTALIVRGIPESNGTTAITEQITMVDSLITEELSHAIAESGTIITRSGYSTVMDMAALGKNPIFVPTPQQTEQEYLAERLHGLGLCYYETQKNFDLERCIEQHRSFRGFSGTQHGSSLLEERLNIFLRSL